MLSIKKTHKGKDISKQAIESKAIPLAEFICREIVSQSVRYIFMVPGGYVDNFSQGIVNSPNLSAIVSASEAGAAMMADGYARASRKFGVCLGISGPGATNMLTSLSLSAADQIPVLVITGEPPLLWRDRDAIQDPGCLGLRSTELLRTIAKVQYQVLDAGAFFSYMQRSFLYLNGKNTGVVNLSVPMCQQTKQITPSSLPIQQPETSSTFCDQKNLTRVLKLIDSQKKIVILIGAGVRKSGATNSLIAFAEAFNLPVATTMSAKGDFPENHDLSLGVFGWAGTLIANELIMKGELDALIVVGSKLGQIATLCWSDQIRHGRTLIQIDSCPEHLNRTYLADLAIVSDAQEAFDYFVDESNIKLSETLSASRKKWLYDLKNTTPWFDPALIPDSDLLPIHPAKAIKQLSALVPDTTQVFVDNGAHNFFATHYWQSTRENHFFNAIKYSGAMGWAIPASIGAKLAQPEKLTLAIVGDGCMLMHGVEIQTAARYKLSNIIFIVMNNQAHGNPKLRATGLSEDAQAHTDIVDHNWEMYAKSLGVKGYTIRKNSELEQTFMQVLSNNEAALIDIKCGLYETPTELFDQSFMAEFKKHLNHPLNN